MKMGRSNQTFVGCKAAASDISSYGSNISEGARG
jgi:hypothetical protein